MFSRLYFRMLPFPEWPDDHNPGRCLTHTAGRVQLPLAVPLTITPIYFCSHFWPGKWELAREWRFPEPWLKWLNIAKAFAIHSNKCYSAQGPNSPSVACVSISQTSTLPPDIVIGAHCVGLPLPAANCCYDNNWDHHAGKWHQDFIHLLSPLAFYYPNWMSTMDSFPVNTYFYKQ